MLPEKQPLLSTIVQSSEVYKDDLQHPGLWLGLCLTFYSQLQWLVVQLVVYRAWLDDLWYYLFISLKIVNFIILLTSKQPPSSGIRDRRGWPESRDQQQRSCGAPAGWSAGSAGSRCPGTPRCRSCPPPRRTPRGTPRDTRRGTSGYGPHRKQRGTLKKTLNQIF